MEIKEIENNANIMKENEKEDKSSLIKNQESINIKEDKMKDYLRDYIMDNRRLVYQRIEGMEPGEDLSIENQYKINIYNNNKRRSKRKIGTNIVLFNKYVFGTNKDVLLLLGTILGMAITWFGWAYTNSYYFSFKIIIIPGIPYILLNYFMILSFLTEPGIIPKDCPEFSKKALEEKEKSKINNENNQENLEIIPKIFKERSCITCNIIRPPGTSHCRDCDNCVQNFDHHCFYISNCVGKRNHKYFYLFLFFGTICSAKIFIIGLISLYKIFIINANETIFFYYKQDKKLFIICASLFIISVLFLMTSCSMHCAIFFFLISFGIYSFLWYSHFYNKKNISFYYNPIILIFYLANNYLLFFVATTFINQSGYISSGYTIKQRASISQEIIEINITKSNRKLKNEYLRERTFKEKIENILKFLKDDIGPSYIVPERDLIE